MRKSINDIFREVVGKVSEKYGKNVSYMFGDWSYISNTLATWGKSSDKASLKYPIICLMSPYTEDRTKREETTSLNFIILINTQKDYTNEQREVESFQKVLRPIYELFINESRKHPLIKMSYDGVIPHQYTENYRYGRLGVAGDNGKAFCDFIDAIEISNFEVTIKTINCNGNRI